MNSPKKVHEYPFTENWEYTVLGKVHVWWNKSYLCPYTGLYIVCPHQICSHSTARVNTTSVTSVEIHIWKKYNWKKCGFNLENFKVFRGLKFPTKCELYFACTHINHMTHVNIRISDNQTWRNNRKLWEEKKLGRKHLWHILTETMVAEEAFPELDLNWLGSSFPSYVIIMVSSTSIIQ